MQAESSGRLPLRTFKRIWRGARPGIWTPANTPAGPIFYSGDIFVDWKGYAIIARLVAQALIRVRVSRDTPSPGAQLSSIRRSPSGSSDSSRQSISS